MHQKKYVEYILKRFNMSNCNLIISPLEIGAKISKNIDEKLVHSTLCKHVIGSQGYLCNTGPYLYNYFMIILG